MNDKAKQLEELASQPADADLIHRATLLTAGRIDMALKLSGLVSNGASRRDLHAFIADCHQAAAPVGPQSVIDSVCKALGVSATTDAERLQAIQIAMTHENTIVLKEVLRQLASKGITPPKASEEHSTVWPFALGAVFGAVIG